MNSQNRMQELEKLAKSLDPDCDRWQARNSIADELQQVLVFRV